MLSQLQQSIIDAPYNKIVVISAAASGKTQTMTEKVRQLLQAGVNPREIAVITFTNLAAAEMRARLGEDCKEGLFIGTIHSLANYFLRCAGIGTDKVLENEEFDKLFKMVEANPQCIKHIEYLILDEAQDTDALQFKFILEMINPPNFFLVGDPRQSIYQFRDARPDIFMGLSVYHDVKTFQMNENYRNKYNILQYAKRIIQRSGMSDNSIAMTNGDGVVIETPFSSELIANKIFTYGEYKDWAIITRTNKEVEQMMTILKMNNIPFDSFKQSDLSRDELIEKMKSNTVKILTIHAAKGLEWPYVCVVGAKFYSDEERNISYVAATRAKDMLIWITAPAKKKVKRFGK